MDVINLIISLLSGAAGGNIAGAAMKDKSLGTLGNTIAGIFGGGIGGSILNALGLFTQGGSDTINLASLIENIAGSGVGGAILLAIVSILKNAFNKA